MTQNEIVLAELKAGERLTSMAAFHRLRITRLAARVYDLRRAGWNIHAETATSPIQGRYATYRLGRPHRRAAA